MELKGSHIALTLTLALLGGILPISTLFRGSLISLVLIAGFAALSLMMLKKVSCFVRENYKKSYIKFTAQFFAAFEGIFFLYFYCEFLKKTALTKTPSLAIFILFFAAIAGIVAMKINSVTCAAHFAAPFIMMFYLGLLATNLNFENVGGMDFAIGTDIAHKGLAIVSVATVFVLTPLLYMPILYHDIKLKILQNGILGGLIIGFILVFGGIFSSLLILGQPLAGVLDFPFYYAASVARGGSLERFESIVSVVSILSGLIHAALCGLIFRSYE